MYLLSSQQMRQLDDLSIHRYKIPASRLMENAGKAAFQVIQKKFSPLNGKKFFIFCGPGNNGGDGLVVARLLQKKKAKVFIFRGQEKITEKPDVIIDALFGTGLSRPLTGLFRSLVEWINKSSAHKVSLDIPSGLSADTGKPLGVAVKADTTITFGFPKQGFFKEGAKEFVGILYVVPIGLSEKAIREIDPQLFLIDKTQISSLLAPRKSNSHKGTYGHVFTIGGCEKTIGAGVMTSYAALRAGAGLSSLILPKGVYQKIDSHALEIMYQPIGFPEEIYFNPKHLPEVLSLLQKATVVALGPGLGTHPDTVQFVLELIKNYQGPLIIDADGLNALATDVEVLKKRKGLTLLTPHPTEMGRLIKRQTSFVQANRWKVAQEFAQKYQITILLKGYRSLVALSNGKIWVNPTGNPAMASAGQGDILTGIYAGLLAQHLQYENQAFLFGCFLHGLIGDLLAGIIPDKKVKIPRRVVLATDIIQNLALGYEFLKKQDDWLTNIFY